MGESITNHLSCKFPVALLQFDVCVDPTKPESVFLYEVYADRAAFDAHLAAEHFKAFDRTVSDWVTTKTVRTYGRLDHA